MGSKKKAENPNLASLKRLLKSKEEDQINLGLELLRGLDDEELADALLAGVKYDEATGKLSFPRTLKLPVVLTLVCMSKKMAARLSRLNLGHVDLASPPAEIGNLVNLKELHLEGCGLASLPAEIGRLANLEKLNVCHNQLTVLPPEIGNLKNLKELVLDSNPLENLPSEIANLGKLADLYLHDNQLKSLPAELGSLTQLVGFHADKELRKEFGELHPEKIFKAKPPSEPEMITNSIGMKFVRIVAGEFMMGASPGDGDARNAEKPRHRVRITKDYYLGQYPVTQGEWKKVMGSNPSEFKGSADLPVESVSWEDAQEFIEKLSKKEGVAYRLPTEAEWEYAARASTETRYYWGDEMDDDYCWYDKNSDGTSQPVGLKKANAWGLYDMLGNVLEWCDDWYAGDHYSTRDWYVEDDLSEPWGEHKALRGGAWDDDLRSLRVSYRYGGTPDSREVVNGLRLARTAD